MSTELNVTNDAIKKFNKAVQCYKDAIVDS